MVGHCRFWLVTGGGCGSESGWVESGSEGLGGSEQGAAGWSQDGSAEWWASQVLVGWAHSGCGAGFGRADSGSGGSLGTAGLCRFRTQYQEGCVSQNVAGQQGWVGLGLGELWHQVRRVVGSGSGATQWVGTLFRWLGESIAVPLR